MEFVEAEQRRLIRDVLRDRRDGIALLGTARVDAGMDIGHEGKEMHAAFPYALDGREERIDQHGFAAADAAIDVEPLGRPRCRLAEAETREKTPRRASAGSFAIRPRVAGAARPRGLGADRAPVRRRSDAHGKQRAGLPLSRLRQRSAAASNVGSAPHRRSTIICLISLIALAGLRPFGHVRVQFMIVWQR